MSSVTPFSAEMEHNSGQDMGAHVTCTSARDAECEVPEPESRENMKRLKNAILYREMGSTKDEKEFWMDSVMVNLEKVNTRGENES